MTHTNTTADSVSVLRETLLEAGQCLPDNYVSLIQKIRHVLTLTERAAIQPAGDAVTLEADYLPRYSRMMNCYRTGSPLHAEARKAEILAYVLAHATPATAPVCTPVQAAPDEQASKLKFTDYTQWCAKEGCRPMAFSDFKAQYGAQTAPEVKQDASALPPLPKGSHMVYDDDEVRAYGQACIDADRAARQPSAASIGDDAEYDALRSALVTALGEHRMVHMYEMEDDGPGASYPLIDRLSLGDGIDIASGVAEIEAIVDAVLDVLAARPPVAAPTEAAPDSARDATRLVCLEAAQKLRTYVGVYPGDKQARRLIDELSNIADALATSAAPGSAEPSAPQWKPITAPGQVKVGDKLRFNIGSEKFSETVKLIIHKGMPDEEIIYNKTRNFYLITSMCIKGTGQSKNVEFLATSSAAKGAA